MKIDQRKWTKSGGWQQLKADVQFSEPPQLVLVFTSTAIMRDSSHFDEIKALYPSSKILLCSTAGEIYDDEVNDESISLAGLRFDKTELKFAETTIGESTESYEVGKRLVEELDKENLVHVMVFSDGLKVNGTSLVRGMGENLPPNVSVTGGLVGDGSDFKETLISFDGAAVSGKVVVVGFYGQNLKIGYGSLGGWDTFGPERVITKSKDNVLYELDGQSALGLYKKYLGAQAEGLPGSGLLFPMELRLKNPDGKEVEIVRTLLAVNEDEQSMTFAGDMPEGIYARLMKANFDRIIDGAAGAANMSVEPLAGSHPELAILISCVGRKLVLKERVEEEIEAVRMALGDETAITGFYSYGEICPTAATEKQCQLHNQTMTITTFRET